MFLAPKTLHNGARNVGQKSTKEAGTEDFRSAEDFRSTENALRRMEFEMKKMGAFRQTENTKVFLRAERAEDFRSTETDQSGATPKQRDVAMETEMELLDGQHGEVSSTSQVRSDDARREAEGRSAERPKNEEGDKEGDQILPDHTLKVRSPDLFWVDSASAYHTRR